MTEISKESDMRFATEDRVIIRSGVSGMKR
jgi:hypothetical protein